MTTSLYWDSPLVVYVMVAWFDCWLESIPTEFCPVYIYQSSSIAAPPAYAELFEKWTVMPNSKDTQEGTHGTADWTPRYMYYNYHIPVATPTLDTQWIDSMELRSVESWWRHQMGTFSASLALCDGNTPVTGEFPSQRSVTRSFDVFFELRLNRRLSKPSRRQWFQTPSRSLWSTCDVWMNLYSVSLISWRKLFHLEQEFKKFRSCSNSEIRSGFYHSS